MDTQQLDKELVERGENTPVTSEGSSPAQTETKPRQSSTVTTKASKVKKAKLKSKDCGKPAKSKSKKAKEVESSSDDSDDSSDSSDDDSDDSSSSSSSSSDTETETKKQKMKRKLKEKKKAKQKAKDKKKAKSKRKAQKDESSDSDSDSDSSDDTSDSAEEDLSDDQDINTKLLQLQLLQQQLGQPIPPTYYPPPGGRGLGRPTRGGRARGMAARIQAQQNAKLGLDPLGQKLKKDKKAKSKKRGSKLEYKRVDQLWDSTIHNYKLTDTAEDEESAEYDQYLFNVRRTFDWEGKYKTTLIDVKSKPLKEALTGIMDGVKGVSLVEEAPAIDPNLLFLYLEDLRKLMKDLKAKRKGEVKMKKKEIKKNDEKIKHIKVLLKYMDKDYAETKKTLYPMLESGLITFDYLWALYKPNTLAYTTTYGTLDEPRAFKIEYAEKEASFMKGEWYSIEGKYLEYDGKVWGMGTMDCDVPAFKGARKITSLACYPLRYHKDEEKVRKELIERGKKFVSLQGVHYKSHEGLAYYKKKRQVIKVNINGRIMIDPAIHRRINPNYQVSTVKPKDPNELEDSSDEEDSDCGCECEESDDDNNQAAMDDVDEPKMKIKVVMDDKKKIHVVQVAVDSDGQEIKPENLEAVAEQDEAEQDDDPEDKTDGKKPIPVFTEEEYLIASPVVLGFAFGEKLWLEFTVSGIKEIVWNDGAYESLVLENNTKDIVKALVESHKYHPAKSIDDVIQGKGKGLVAVLHGPPGTGKTLTAEGIAELLKCPLYMVSAGELGTDPRTLEAELQKILDISMTWGCVLLLDEADVFLEKRTIQDIHRNALVSIFLRLLEYFQGILFLTTNRVETFDDAFQSRIHIALRYGELSTKAKKAVFQMFLEKVRVLEGTATLPFTEADFTDLAKHNLNGRQIKNTVRTAQALAVNQKEPLSMVHIRRVLDVALAFERDLKGGTGYEDAMRNYY
ncbi:hypothetical protein V495_00840 [Pseudogymnoascus sp. VKM F-4514 (FW-929)]|nr:hypothetical protein V495_00840 [Pseudogymnoascus sp. VKM F-4514 (FW-929)]KFY61039.1 hypothetical protein V497_03165 [Pseudogymnoascus sp. VKM F-4516 (FW-969)]